MNTPKQIPHGFRRISVEKKIPPEGAWLYESIYENADKKQIIFNEVPRRAIRCYQEEWKNDLAAFKPAGSSDGCSFYMDQLIKNNKAVQLHWFLWNKGDRTYSIYDEESVLPNPVAMAMAESLGPGIVIAKDLTNKK